jgi:hypothetical protein
MGYRLLESFCPPRHKHHHHRSCHCHQCQPPREECWEPEQHCHKSHCDD